MPFAAMALTDELTRPSGESCGTCGAPGREPPPSSESGRPNAPCSSDPGGRLSGFRTQSAISCLRAWSVPPTVMRHYLPERQFFCYSGYMRRSAEVSSALPSGRRALSDVLVLLKCSKD